LKKRCRIFPAGGLVVTPKIWKSSQIRGFRRLIEAISTSSMVPLKKRCRILPAGDLGVSLSF
jgi:hypothetical protein